MNIPFSSGALCGAESLSKNCSDSQLNTVTFKPVTVKAVRLEVKLREGFSGGILEWRVGE